MDLVERPPLTSQAAVLRAAVEPLPPLDDPAFGAAFDRFAQSRVVLLGEASHGTCEFYRARAAITRRLIEQHGSNVWFEKSTAELWALVKPANWSGAAVCSSRRPIPRSSSTSSPSAFTRPSSTG